MNEYTVLKSASNDICAHPSSVMYTERKWIGEFGFSTMFSDYQLTDDASENEADRHTHSSGHIWLSPHLQACYTGMITDSVTVGA